MPRSPEVDLDPEDTPSFSVSAALRAPVGSRLEPDHLQAMRLGAGWLMAAIACVLVDVNVASGVVVDVVPDLLGGIFVLVGVDRVNRVTRVVGPTRAAGRLVLLAVLQLPLLLALTVVPTGLRDPYLTLVDSAGMVQLTIGLLGTAIVGTVLGRAHDAIGQLRRRARWASARRASIATAAVTLVGGLLVALSDEPSGLHELVVGFASAVLLVFGVVTLVLVVRALMGSLNVLGPER